jgi:FkbM family methyltransferase
MDLIIARALYVQRAWEVDLITRSIAFLKREGYLDPPGRDLMIDAGANVGKICIALLRRGYFREAVAIEAGPENFALLERNIAQNGMADTIRAIHVAVSDRIGSVEIELSELNFGDHRVRPPGAAEPGRLGEERRATVQVPARTLDDIVARGPGIDPSRIGLIWVDVQGHEGQLVRGARETLAHGAPVLTEFWPYGIRRSGLDRNEYFDIVRAHFDRVLYVDAAADRFEPIGWTDLAALFDAHVGPDEFVELLLLPRRGGPSPRP